jgi:hypothetical protein
LQLQNALFAVFFSVAGLGAIAVFTLRQFINHLLRLLFLVISNVWLCFFFGWSDGNLIGLMPPDGTVNLSKSLGSVR